MARPPTLGTVTPEDILRARERSPTWPSARRCCRRDAHRSARDGVVRSRPRTCSARARSRSAAPQQARGARRWVRRGVIPRERGHAPPGPWRSGPRARRALRGLHAGRGVRWRRSRVAGASGRSCIEAAPTSRSCVSTAPARAQRARHGSRPPVRRPRRDRRPGSVGLEVLEQVSDLAKVVVLLGGGGLASGLAIAVKKRASGDRGDRRPGRPLWADVPVRRRS